MPSWESYLVIEILVCFLFCVLNESWSRPHWLLYCPLTPCPLSANLCKPGFLFTHIFHLPTFKEKSCSSYGALRCFKITLYAFSSGAFFLLWFLASVRQVRADIGVKSSLSGSAVGAQNSLPHPLLALGCDTLEEATEEWHLLLSACCWLLTLSLWPSAGEEWWHSQLFQGPTIHLS